MRTIGFPALIALGLASSILESRADDPRKIDPTVVSSAVAAVAKGETVRIVPGASGFNLYGDGKTGSVVSSAGGFTIYYNGTTSRVVKSASGWTVYKK